MTWRVAPIAAAVLVAIAATTLLSPRRGEDGSPPLWHEVAWPFAMDQWGKGKAYRCEPADCGTEVQLYLRSKLGSCDCAAGVADDEALDRMSDLDLVGSASPLAAGRLVAIGHMKGRSRVYAFNARSPFGNSAIAIAFSDRCDMIVATAVLQDRGAVAASDVVAFLNSEAVSRWIEQAVGL